MKVLVVNWRDIRNPEAGGAEVHIDEILKRKPADWEVDFVASTYPECIPEETINGYRVVRIPNKLNFHISFRKYWKNVLSKNHYDLVIDDVSKIPLATIKYITDTPILAIDHHIHGKTLFTELFFPFAFYVYLMERYYLQYYVDIPLIACSESTYEELNSLYDYKKCQVLYNGIDFGHYAGNRAKKTDYPLLATYGRMKRYKRIDHLIRAFGIVLREFPNARFSIGGKGDDEQNLKKLVETLGLSESIRFLGFTDPKTMAQTLSQAWVFGIASQKEGWAIVNIEANAAGTPVVGYNVEGVRNSVKDGVTGFLAEDGSVEQLAAKIGEIFRNEPLRRQMSRNAVEWASEFSWEKTASKFYEIAAQTVNDFNK